MTLLLHVVIKPWLVRMTLTGKVSTKQKRVSGDCILPCYINIRCTVYDHISVSCMMKGWGSALYSLSLLSIKSSFFPSRLKYFCKSIKFTTSYWKSYDACRISPFLWSNIKNTHVPNPRNMSHEGVDTLFPIPILFLPTSNKRIQNKYIF